MASRSVRSTPARSVSEGRRSSWIHLASSNFTHVDLFIKPDSGKDAGDSQARQGGNDMTTAPATTVHDFDFLVGTWRITSRRLNELLVGSDDWDEFPATAVGQRFFDGAGSFDTVEFPTK